MTNLGFARKSVQVNARFNVNALHAPACYSLSMKEGWFERLESAIGSDPRSLSQLSVDARLGRNFVQQMLKDRKEPGAERLSRLLDALGPEVALYVITGLQVDSWDIEFLKAASGMSKEAKQDLLKLAQTLSKQPHEPEAASDL